VEAPTRRKNFVEDEAGGEPIVPAQFDSGLVMSVPEEPVLPATVRGPAQHLVNPSRVSRVISIGSAGDQAPRAGSAASAPGGTERQVRGTAEARARAFERGSARPDEEEATVVDGSGAALTVEQNTALARRIQAALDQTLPTGTPLPVPVQTTPAPPEAGERNPRWFKQTMLLGLVRPPPPEVAPSEPPPSSVLRASFVRSVGPPTSPPPRRSRRSAPPLGFDAEPSSGTELEAGPFDPEPLDHEAFELDHPIVAPEPAPWSEGVARSGRAPGSDLDDVRAADSRPKLILPPAPGRRELEPARAPYVSQPARRQLERSGATVGRPALVRSTPLLTDLPSADPFAGFVAPAASVTQRWGLVLVIALAVVGLFSLAAIALGLLGKTGW
jgi:hypothetical protein